MRAVAALVLVLVPWLAACEREMRRFDKPMTLPPPPAGERRGEVQPGMPGTGLTPRVATPSYDEKVAYELAQGKQLFRWYNCSGCHSLGGGGMGPALMDAEWIYGHDPQTIFTTIMDGRPNGMPSFRGRIPEAQVWQLVAYVRSMSLQVPFDAAPGRHDGIAAVEPELRRDRLAPSKVQKP